MRLLRPFGRIMARRNPNSRAMTHLWQPAEAKPPRPANDRYELRKISAPDALASAIGALRRKRAFRGTSTPRGNEGVGEHVRTRFHSGLLAPVKLRIVKDTRTERRKACFFCRTGFERAASFERTLFRNTIQPFDLMSRRHPLSSTRAFRFSSGARVTCRHQAAGNSWRSEVTSSSWRPCGSSSQSSSLRSSPSLPS